MVITFDFTSRTTIVDDRPLRADQPQLIRKIDIHRNYAPMCIGNFIDDINWDDVEQLSDDLALCLAITTLFRPEHKEMVYEWATANLDHINTLRVADQLAMDLESLFALNEIALRDYAYKPVPSERAFNEIVDALDAIE